MYNKDTVKLAKRLYVKDGWSIENIAADLKVGYSTVRSWSQKGQWEFERKEQEESLNSLGEKAYSFATFLMDDVRKKEELGMVYDKNQCKILEVLLNNSERLIRADIERKKLAKTDTKDYGLPEEVSGLPRVQEALKVIEKALNEFNRGMKNGQS